MANSGYRGLICSRIERYEKPYKLEAGESIAEFVRRYGKLCENIDETRGIPQILTFLGAKRLITDLEDDGLDPGDQAETIHKLLDDDNYILIIGAREILERRLKELK